VIEKNQRYAASGAIEKKTALVRIYEDRKESVLVLAII